MAVSVATPKKGIVDYVKDLKRADCAVCKLSPEIQEQLKIARKKEIPRATVREYLKAVYGKEVPEADFTGHVSGHHDG